MQVIDKQYEVLKPLGQGLAGEVFQVKKGNQLLALKLLKEKVGGLSSGEAEAHFKAEFSILKQLSHPNIAKILDFGIDPNSGRYYYTTEFIDGKNLFEATRGSSLEKGEEYFIQALRALEYLQAHGISHYDLKPENLLVDIKKEELKIIDFGMAGFRPRAHLAGTPSYMAPEIIFGENPDARADLYSLGVTCYECLTGQNPFRAKTVAETLRRQESFQPPPAHLASPEVSEALSEVVGQLLMKNPAERPATAGAALRILAQLSGKKISLETETTSLSYLPNETKLIGREKPLATFRQRMLEVLQSPQGQPLHAGLWIHGEDGLGKTRLLKEFRFQAQLAGLRVHPLAEAKLPELSEPCAVLLDDASPDDIPKLQLALETSPCSTLLVSASVEPPPPGISTSLERAELLPFKSEEVREFLGALTGMKNPPENLVIGLENRTGGNPRDLTETLREIIRQGGLFDEHGRWSAETLEDLGIDLKEAPTPEKLTERLDREFKKLDAPARTLLQWLGPITEPVPAEALQDRSELEDFSYWILELLTQGWIGRDETTQGYFIKNPALKDLLVRQLAGTERGKIHASWAKFYEPLPNAAELALYHRGRGGKNPKAQEALVQLAKRQEARGQLKEAVENLKLADHIPNEDLIAAYDIKNKIAIDLILWGRQSEAMEILQAMQEDMSHLPQDQASTRVKIAALEKLGITYLRGNSLDKARDCFDAGLKLSEKLRKEFPQKEIVFKNYLGRILFQEGKLQEAQKIFSDTQEAVKKLTAEQRNTLTNNDLGMVWMALGKFNEAKEQFLTDLNFFESLKEEVFVTKCLYNLGEVEAALKNPKEAIRYYQRCIELAKGQKNLEILLRAYNGLGNLHSARREFGEASRQFERALAIAQKIGDFLSQAGIETNLGIVMNTQEKPRQSLPHLKAALRLLESLGKKDAHQKYLAARAALELGEVSLKLGDFSAAHSCLEQAWQDAVNDKYFAPLRFPTRAAQAKLAWREGHKAAMESLAEECEKLVASPEEKVEWAKLKNLLQQAPEAAAREPAVTETNLSAPGRAEESIMLSSVGEGGYAKLLELTRFINAETDLDYVLKSVLQYALELSGAERGLLLLLDERDRLEIRASINTSLNPTLSEISSKVAEQVLHTGELLETDDATSDARFNEYQSVMILKLRSILCLPIHSRHKTVGVLYLDHRYRSKAVSRSRHPVLQAFCDQAGIAIENARLFEKYEQAQTQLTKRLEQAEAEAEHYHELLGENVGQIPTKYNYDRIVSRSKGMHEVFKLLDKITETNISVFINGETGTGKELIAKALHYNNKQRAEQRFVAINCGGIPANLIESELFGYKAGAFTGASKDRKGLFAEADGGTIFLDELAELDMALQVKLLRALQEGEVTPVGDNRPIKFDVRVVSASHKNLEDLIASGKFREDLYYRICQIRLPLPPLRERREDIPPLAEKFVADYGREHGLKKFPKISGSLMKKLLEYSWPGNIRELENTLRVTCALSDGKDLTVKDLPQNFGRRQAAPGNSLDSSRHSSTPPSETNARAVSIDEANSYDSRLNWEDYEKRIFAKAYEAAGFNPMGAAGRLDVSPATFYKRIKEFDLNNQSNPLYREKFVVKDGKALREFLEDIFWAAYQASGEKAYTAIKWLQVSQGHFYNVLKAAKARRG